MLGLKSVDVLVLCNVLHEIPVSDWLSMFGEHGLIRMLLREDGSLLLVEDAQLPVGEKAHAKGFLVLNTAELFQLFDFKPEESGYARSDVRGDGRLLGHLIPARCLARLNKETLGKTLKSVQADAIDRIKVLRALPPSYPNGRKHAFHVQQLANATLELIERGE